MEQASSPQKPARVVSSGASKREIWLGILGALVVVGLVGYAVTNMGNTAVRTAISGQVMEKTFVPRPEEQITIGPTGVDRTEKAGQYYLSVQVRDSKEIYKVRLSQEDYDRVKVGDSYNIPKASLVP